MNIRETLQLSWSDVSSAVSKVLSEILGRNVVCGSATDSHDYWCATIKSERISLAEMTKIFTVIDADEETRIDTLCEGEDFSAGINSFGLKVSEGLLKIALKAEWERFLCTDDVLYLILSKREHKKIIKSQQIFSPQSYLDLMTGECYFLDHDCDPISEIHKILKKHGVEDENNAIWDYPFDEISHLCEQQTSVVLVDISGYGNPYGEEWKTEYRWFEVPDDFEDN